MVAVRFGGAAPAPWIRTKIAWTTLGRFLYGRGLITADGMLRDLRKGKRMSSLETLPIVTQVRSGKEKL